MLKKITKYCLFCNSEYTGTKNTKFCSTSCGSKNYATVKENLSIFNQCNPTYFKSIDTVEKAYWLGFAFADGYVNQRETVFRFHLSVEDENHLDRFIEAVGGNPETKKYYGPYKTAGKSVQFYILNREFVSNLIDKGCNHKKSLTLSYPNLDSTELNFSFLAGYFDGDGCQNTTDIVSGSYNFLAEIQNKFELNTKILKRSSCYSLSYGVNLFRKTREVVGDLGLKRKNTLYGRHFSDSDPNLKRISYPKKINYPEAISTKTTLKNSYCPNCNGPKSFGGKLCSTCHHSGKEKIIWPSRDELEILVWSTPSSVLSKTLGVSDKAIEKRCKKLGIEKPGLGYWAKKAAGKI